MYRGCLEVFRGVLDMYKVVYTCVAGVHRYPYGNESVYKGVYYTGCESDTKTHCFIASTYCERRSGRRVPLLLQRLGGLVVGVTVGLRRRLLRMTHLCAACMQKIRKERIRGEGK